MISGGPVYVSDKPGRHDPSLLARLAPLPGGCLLQPLLPGRPCRDSLFVDVCGDRVSALKVWNMNACGGVLALFNVQVRGPQEAGCSNQPAAQLIRLGHLFDGQSSVCLQASRMAMSVTLDGSGDSVTAHSGYDYVQHCGGQHSL